MSTAIVAEEPEELALLRELVDEIAAKHPLPEGLAGPIDVRFDSNDEVNAYASPNWDLEDPDTGWPRATITVNAGLFELFEGDVKLIRAVVAHEVGHLVRGHVLTWVAPEDLNHQLTRRQEREADLFAAWVLDDLGYGRACMVDALLAIDRDSRQAGMQIQWLNWVGSSHASPISRAAIVAQNDEVLEAVAVFEYGMAFAECRRLEDAIRAFDRALVIEPRLDEAAYNVARVSLQNYHEKLPQELQQSWLWPAMGPLLLDVPLDVYRGAEPTDEDLKRYMEARRRISEIRFGFEPELVGELAALADVLHPTGDRTALERGVATLRARRVALRTEAPLDAPRRMRVSTNLALGLDRLGHQREAAQILYEDHQLLGVGYERATALGLAKLAGRAPLTGNVRLAALKSIMMLAEQSDTSGETFSTAVAAIERLWGKSEAADYLQSLGDAPAVSRRAARMVVGDDSFELFDAFAPANVSTGVLQKSGDITEDGVLQFHMWGSENVPLDLIVLSEGSKLVKVTTYREGAYIELVPNSADERKPIRVTIGMPLDEIENLLYAPGREWPMGANIPLLGRSLFLIDGEEENWFYFPGLSMGVLLKDDRVAGLTMATLG